MVNWHLTQITYHSMIKAFGKCGDIQKAFQIVDEMAKADVAINVVTYSFLLMSCISNKEAGFTYAVEVWRKMKARKIVPNLFTCNLLLRAARDCDIGPEEISCLLLQHWTSYPKRPYGFVIKDQPKKTLLLEVGNKNESMDENNSKEQMNEYDKIDCSSQNEINVCKGTFPVKEESNNSVVNIDLSNAVDQPQNYSSNLLESRPIHGPEILELVNISSPSDRLALIGGMEGFLESMTKYGVQPDIKTFTLLLENLPSDLESEEKLISLLDVHKVKPDMDFINILIKKRHFRKDSKNARNALTLANKYGVTPDIVTFGVLALGCRTLSDAQIFLGNMKKFGYCPNIEIVGALHSNACKSMSFKYMEVVLNFMEKRDIKPNKKMLTDIEKTLEIARKNIIDMEHGKEVDKVFKQENFSKMYKDFCKYYEQWLQNNNVEVEEHPWAQYETDITVRSPPEDLSCLSK